jgi:hypothetical protein
MDEKITKGYLMWGEGPSYVAQRQNSWFLDEIQKS